MERYKIGMQKVAYIINKLNIISTNIGDLRLIMRKSTVNASCARLLIQYSLSDKFD
ncbi:hypothetical protein J4O15_01920 [Lachnoanaerobaculum sp. Marseille-Q4761]|uniref:hypothetical protein n=1 Tax=Lachnoanaerobaculum sp. Marseille-Q4761 TaxID=2819511 RepID=UPI001AA10B8D|nr:hypothetical protein [Lachnoanaerobaculum sp. Marseille-Q4761]MBO1869737.1 hypothetical protein [Lachnoanaerobaculum sp. Marseille-Q4761]